MPELDNTDLDASQSTHDEQNHENVGLVQLLSVIRNEQPPPGSAIIAQVPETESKPKGSAKRKTAIKTRKIFDGQSPKKQGIDRFSNKFDCDKCGISFPQPYRLSRCV